ncbi:hypothetical protein [Saccharibacillus alkalitolerans]|uniref:DUF4868 domain-containing protein n=1 Tax=Saccharibacillus alkalitolerans TaxID=2705290 RepID=A0ABX0EZJ8_9BACL|nr:hypothetical protein [Saccharibacillus alkalitolerans]NGZ74071.1 hypothetical protein [Saccharibacillus alkalitolerans]
MTLQKIWVCTSKSAKLHRICLLQTDNDIREDIFKSFEDDLQTQQQNESSIVRFADSALIDDIPYFISLSDIATDDYLQPFKEKVTEILDNPSTEVIRFSNNPTNAQGISNLEENEAIKFIIAQSNESLYFLEVPKSSVIKHRLVLTLGITQNSTVLKVPKGIQVPAEVTARVSCADRKLFVYDVNKFERMLTLNENQKAKSFTILDKFVSGEFKISSEDYTFTGLGAQDVRDELKKSIRATRRLAKYKPDPSPYSINKIKDAVNKLDSSLQVSFDDSSKTIHVTADTAKTFVAIIYNSIVERLITGKVELAI